MALRKLMKRIPKLIITSGDPAGIGLDLCVMLAFKKFLANKSCIDARRKNDLLNNIEWVLKLSLIHI